MCISKDPLRDLFDRHAARRMAGVPTVTVLVGPPGAGGREWRRWVEQTGRVTIAVTDPASAPASWLAALADRIDLPLAAVHFLADRLGRDRGEFRVEWNGKTAADSARFWQSVYPGSAPREVRLLAELAAGGRKPAGREVTEALLAGVGSRVALRELLLLEVAGAVPAVLFLPPYGVNATEWFTATADGMAGFANSLPSVPVAAALSADAWATYLAAAPASRFKSLLKEGVAEVPVLDTAEVEKSLLDAGLGPDAATTARVLSADGATADLATAAADAVRANVPPPQTSDANDRARSKAERFLFTLLESIPETAGRFELNGTLDFRFGPQAAEIDLLARHERIAVEVDGYYHFRDSEAYRRDRAKDYELQRRGYFVMRFLAEDVVRRLEQVRDRILEVFTKPPPGGAP